MDVEAYINQFHIVGENNIDCDTLSKLLYKLILNKFKIEVDEKEYPVLCEYQERVFEFVENMRENEIEFIEKVFDYLKVRDEYLVDIVIMFWCTPRPMSDNYASKKIYNNRYKDNIGKYNAKLVQIIHHPCLKNFCIETLSKNNNVTVHCIDYLWYYMDGLSLDFFFDNYENGNYISFNICPDDFLGFGFCLEYLLEMGLGRVVYPDDPKGPLVTILKKFVSDIGIIKTMASKNKNYIKQVRNIIQNPKKYFDDQIAIPSDVSDYIKGSSIASNN